MKFDDIPTHCPLCGGDSPRISGRTHAEGQTVYTHYECSACKVQFWWPLKNPGAEWYSSNVRYGGRNHDPVWEANKNHTKTLSVLSAHRGSVFDVGCGIGNFLELAKKRGWECAGIDFDPDAIEAVRKKTGIVDLEVTDVVSYAARHPTKRFDLITFFDVLEHVDNHNEFIASIKSILKPGGFLAMSMPYRKHAIWLMPRDLPPGHLTCWDRASLRRFLEARGFSIVYITRRSEGVWHIVMKLRFRFGALVSFDTVRAVRAKLGDSGARPGKRPFLVRAIHVCAKIKDALLFGLPALLIWLIMFMTPRRYVTLYAVAQMRA